MDDGDNLFLSKMADMDTKGKETNKIIGGTKLDLNRVLAQEEKSEHRTAAGRLAWVFTGNYSTSDCIASMELQEKQKCRASQQLPCSKRKDPWRTTYPSALRSAWIRHSYKHIVLMDRSRIYRTKTRNLVLSSRSLMEIIIVIWLIRKEHTQIVDLTRQKKGNISLRNRAPSSS